MLTGVVPQNPGVWFTLQVWLAVPHNADIFVVFVAVTDMGEQPDVLLRVNWGVRGLTTQICLVILSSPHEFFMIREIV